MLGLAERAARLAAHDTPAIRARTLAAIAAHHDPRTARTALREAERLHAKADPAPGPFTHYPAAALHHMWARTLLTLGDTRHALAAFALSLHLRAPHEARATALTHAHFAEALLALGHLDQAVHHWQQCLATAPQPYSARVLRHLAQMRQLLRPHTRHARAQALLLAPRA